MILKPVDIDDGVLNVIWNRCGVYQLCRNLVYSQDK